MLTVGQIDIRYLFSALFSMELPELRLWMRGDHSSGLHKTDLLGAFRRAGAIDLQTYFRHAGLIFA